MSYAEKREGKLTGRWVGQCRIKGETLRRIFETRKAANGYEAYVRETGEEPAHLNEAKLVGPTFRECAEHCIKTNLTWKRGRDPSGRHRLDYLIDRLGPKPVAMITKDVLTALVQDLARRPAQRGGGKLSMGTINRYLSAASAVLSDARSRGLLEVQPVIPWQEDKGHRIHWLSEDQEKLVIAWLRAQNFHASALVVRVLCSSGLRWSEFISLESHQVQSEWIKLDKTKTDTPRDVPVHPKLLGELRAMVTSGGSPNYQTFRTQLKAAFKACGLSPELGVHNLRHSTATRLTKKKTPTEIVRKFLGHKSVTTTMKYIHVEDDDLMEASRNLYTQCGPEDDIEVATVLPFASKVS
jgi:integrase